MKKLISRISDWVELNDLLRVDHLVVCAIVAVLVSILGWLSLNLSMFSPIKRAFDDFSMTDVYYQIQSRENKESADEIVLVDMTELTDRSEIADLIARINLCEPKVLVVDMIFQHRSEQMMADDHLAEVALNSPNTIFSCKLTNWSEKDHEFKNVVKSYFGGDEGDGISWAYSNVYEEVAGGCVREFSLSQQLCGDYVYSIPYLTKCMWQDTPPTDVDQNMRIVLFEDKYVTSISHSEVASKGEMLRGKIVVLGAMNEEADTHITPVGKMAGMKLQAYSMLSVINHPDVKVQGVWGSLLMSLLLCYISAWAGWKITLRFPNTFSHVKKLYYFLLLALLVWLGFVCFVRFNYNLSLLLPMLGVSLVEEARNLWRWLISYLSAHDKWEPAKKSIYAVKK